MNGYQLQADAYKRYIERENPTGEARASAERKIAALEFMASSDRQTQFELFNSSGFNDVCKGYYLMALDKTGADDETKKETMRELKHLFDTVTAEQAEQYYTEEPTAIPNTSDTENLVLQACPFCGAKQQEPNAWQAVRLNEQELHTAAYGIPCAPYMRYRVICGRCGAGACPSESGNHCGIIVTPEQARQRAIDKWNRRTAGRTNEQNTNKTRTLDEQ